MDYKQQQIQESKLRSFITMLSEHFSSFSDNEKLEQFQNFIENFYVDKTQPIQVVWSSHSLFKDTYISEFFVKWLAQADLLTLTKNGENKEIHNFLMNLDLHYFYNHNDSSLKINNHICFYQAHFFKENLLKGDFDKITPFFVNEFYDSFFNTTGVNNSQNNQTTREKLLQSQTEKMVLYFLNGDTSKLSSVYNLSNKLRDPISSKFKNTYLLFKDTPLHNNVLFNYVLRFEEPSTLYPHKLISANNDIELDLKDFLFNDDSWKELPEEKQMYLFSKVFLLNYPRFTEDEDDKFKSLFIELMDKIEQKILNEKSVSENIFHSCNITAPLLLQYSPEHVGMFLEEHRTFKLDMNYRSLISNANQGDNLLDIPSDDHDFLFKSLFVSKIIYTNNWWQDFINETYYPFVENLEMLDSSVLMNKKPENLGKLIADISNVKNNHHLRTNTRDSLFYPLAETVKQFNCSTLDDYLSKYLLFLKRLTFSGNSLFPMQPSHSDSRVFVISDLMFENFSQKVKNDLITMPLDILHTVADEFYNLQSYVSSKGEIVDENPKARVLSNVLGLSLINHNFDKNLLDKLLVSFEEEILNRTIPTSKSTTRNTKKF